MNLPSEPFGPMPDGSPTALYTLQNEHLRVRITDYGGHMVSIEAPDRQARHQHVLLGFDSLAAYRANGGAFGTLLGRYANRIAGAQVTLDGQTYQLSRNNGDATLHGGAVGFDKQVWQVTTAESDPVPTLILRHVSPDGDQGFPGELAVEATYRLTASTLSLSFQARTTRPTVINLSAHPYFNLGGPEAGDVLRHEATIGASTYLPTDAGQIPTGELQPVDATPFDFRQPRRLGAEIRQPDPQLLVGLGYDHCFVLGATVSDTPRLAVRLRDPDSGRVLEIHTDQPGLQVYTGNKLTGAFAGHGGVIYRQSAGVALEAQDLPDAPHHPHFPSTELRPGTTFRRTIEYRFLAT